MLQFLCNAFSKYYYLFYFPLSEIRIALYCKLGLRLRFKPRLRNNTTEVKPKQRLINYTFFKATNPVHLFVEGDAKAHNVFYSSCSSQFHRGCVPGSTSIFRQTSLPRRKIVLAYGPGFKCEILKWIPRPGCRESLYILATALLRIYFALSSAKSPPSVVIEFGPGPIGLIPKTEAPDPLLETGVHSKRVSVKNLLKSWFKGVFPMRRKNSALYEKTRL